MKFNKWTLGLAAVGAVSLASVVRADDAPKMSALNTALSNTTISGYVSTSVNWQLDPGNSQVPNSPGGNIPLQGNKANGFNLDVAKIVIAKPEDETPWASGYEVDLLFGPDAVGYDLAKGANGITSNPSDFGINQAFVTLRTPVGSGIDWKIGQFNTIVGYESFDAGSNPNYTRSWGWAVEPTTHTGILASYNATSELSLSAGVANTLEPGINTRNTYNDSNGRPWHKTVMGSATFTAPSSWGWASGSAFYVGDVYGFAGGNGAQGGNQNNFYAGATLNSPWSKVTFGGAFDYVQNLAGEGFFGDLHADDYIFGLYNTIKATDKLSFNTRGEYWDVDFKGGPGGHNRLSDEGISLTETVEYDLWANVVSRLEFRYDKVITSDFGEQILPTGVFVDKPTSYGLYANIIYKF
jgi:hypothetical protein